MAVYRDWEQAARNSKFEKAVGEQAIELPNGEAMRVEVVKPMHRDGFLVYPKSGVVIRQATPKEVDTAKLWRPF